MADQGRIDGRTQLIGLLATPIGHSLSPAMHNMSFRKLGLNYAYMAFEVGNEQLEDVLTGLRALNVRGWNVSMPNKTKILPFLDELTPAAQFAGAVNTVVNEDGKLVGHITDGTGYVRGLQESGVDIKGKKITLMGAGGAATAIAIQCAIDGAAEIYIFNRDDEFYDRAVKNVDIINNEIKDITCNATLNRLEDLDQLKASIANSDILINGTGVGMKPYEEENLVADASWLRPELIVSDVVYIPRKTKLLEMAESVGCKTVNGLGMMLWQGAKAFELWTGQEMPVDHVKEQMF
ncbi:shikimate dehydrogenase [Bacillus sp. B15-48]|uniref:shikimate dehydrogenase n=1 Tax=Bacillus sp. B15-48 TaxID=1548601 RepID=UPI0019400B92|nr:shikimate dehydrogenase [Bacillus sp. B15-48]MBM4762872.1 shikimate dehydrogenase [Bacillus sp. B15-48]